MSIYYGTPAEHAASFANLQQVISDEASIALNAFEKLLEQGWTKKQIVDDFNSVFKNNKNKFKTYKELEKYLMQMGI